MKVIVLLNKTDIEQYLPISGPLLAAVLIGLLWAEADTRGTVAYFVGLLLALWTDVDDVPGCGRDE